MATIYAKIKYKFDIEKIISNNDDESPKIFDLTAAIDQFGSAAFTTEVALLEPKEDEGSLFPPTMVGFTQFKSDLVDGEFTCTPAGDRIRIECNGVFKFAVRDRFISLFLDQDSDWALRGVTISNEISGFEYDISVEPIDEALEVKRTDVYRWLRRNEEMEEKFHIIDVCTSKKAKELAAVSKATNSQANKIKVSEYFMLRIGFGDSVSEGDFLDNIEQNMWLAVAISEDHEYLVIENEKLGCHIFAKGDFRSDAGKLVSKIPLVRIDYQTLLGLYVATFERNSDALCDLPGFDENNFFSADETDDIEDFAPCIFGAGSVTSDVCGVWIELKTKQVTQDDHEISSLSDLYGRIDESETWVVGFKV